MAAGPPPDKPAWLDQAPAWLPPPGAASPEPPPPTPDEPAPPPAWNAPTRSSSRPWIYLAAAALIVVLVIGVYFVRGQILAFQAANNQTYVVTSPTPFLSDYERADRFINIDLTPAFAGVITPLQSVENSCTPSSMAPSCKAALIATDKAMVAAEDAINKGDIPICVAREVLQFKNDWIGMEQGVALAISGFNNNSQDLYLQGFVKFAEIAQYLQPDMDRITAAENTCSKAAR